MPCPECPETPDTGCLHPITTECVTYNGNDVDCANIASGQTLNQVIEQLANNDCDLQEQLDDLEDDLQELSGVVLTIEDKIQELSGNQYEFSCEELSECELNSLGNVDTNPVSGDSIIFNGEKWINYTPASAPTYTSSNGITLASSNFKLGGTLVNDTSILGANFDLIFGTSGSALDDFKVYSNKFLGRGTVISLSETGDETTQTKGFLYKTASTSVSIGTTVFDDFSTYAGNFRIGNNITLAKTGILDPAGFFMGTNIAVDSSPAYAIGADIDLTNFIGVVLGITNTAAGYAGGFLMGSELDLMGGGTGNQSAYIFGAKVDVTFGAGIAQGALVFNPTNTQINSSATGNATNEKIRVDQTNGFVATFNANDYYFFTDVGNAAGWNVNNDVVRFNKNFVQISGSTGSVTEEKAACIRYNTSTNKLQVYTGSAWETVTSS